MTATTAATAEGHSPTPRRERKAKPQRAPFQALLMTPEEVAAELQYSRSKVYELLKDGRLKSLKDGRHRRIERAALAEYLDTLRAESQRAG